MFLKEKGSTMPRSPLNWISTESVYVKVILPKLFYYFYSFITFLFLF